jgi:hypothetical protein
VHGGFLAALSEVWVDVAAHIIAEQKRAARPLWIVGHSLGAALATVAANLCCDDSEFGLKGIYTYGSPRVGDRGFGARIRVPVFRFRNDSDVVSHLSLGLVFHHVGRLQFIDGAGHLHRDVPDTIELMFESGARMVSARDAVTIQHAIRIGGSDLPLPGFLADHAPINYGILAWNCYEAEFSP